MVERFGEKLEGAIGGGELTTEHDGASRRREVGHHENVQQRVGESRRKLFKDLKDTKFRLLRDSGWKDEPLT